jgi:hypothetical protein
LKDGKLISGSVSAIDGKWVVKLRTATIERMVWMLFISGRTSHGWPACTSGILELWTGGFDFSLARGRQFGNNKPELAFNADRTTNRDKTSFFAAALYSTNNTTGESITTANIIEAAAIRIQSPPRLLMAREVWNMMSCRN